VLCAKANRSQDQGSRRLLDLCRRHGSDISCAHALTPSAAMRDDDWHCAELGMRPSRKLRDRDQATGGPSGKPTAMSAKAAQNLQQRSDAVMASVPTSLRNPFPKARQVSIRCERRWGRQRQLKVQARLATERRARQTERCPAYNENRLCRGKPHGRRQGGKDLASDRGRCATLQNSAEHATQQGAS